MAVEKEKKRPEDNDHCFEGLGRPYWLAKAKGFTIQDIKQGPAGSSLDYALDSDEKALQNGGMHLPQETRMPPGVYFRFYGTVAHNRFGAAGCMAGGWWIEPEAYFATVALANRRDISLAKAAQAMLVIPEGWHDCGYVGKALLNRKLKAYVGKGKPASSTASPHNPNRNPATDPVLMPPGGQVVKQWFVPGDRALLSRFVEVQAVVHCIKKGIAL